MTEFGPRSTNVLRPTRLLLAGGLLSITCALAAVMLARANEDAPRDLLRLDVPRKPPAPPLPLPEQNVLRPLTSTEALIVNAGVPLSREPLEAARPFTLGGGPGGAHARTAAIDCLTAAIYYEAAADGEAGERAVAQVVLNRVRHPAFPSSVCGVVYQGSDRPTGCQFTFTCDGSLSRKPSERGWAAAQRIAVEALDGKVDRAVGMATHYHANFVVPYWASDLSKITVIGTQIFYRWNGYWGRRAAFKQPYAGETALQNDLAAVTNINVQPVDPSEQLAVPRAATLVADMASGKLAAKPLDITNSSVLLRADEKLSTLEVDEANSPLRAPDWRTGAHKSKPPSTNPIPNERLRLSDARPL